MALNSIVSERFRAILSAQQISVEDYAKETGRTREAARRRLNGSIPISLADLDEFCSITGYKPNEILQEQFILKPSTEAS